MVFLRLRLKLYATACNGPIFFENETLLSVYLRNLKNSILSDIYLRNIFEEWLVKIHLIGSCKKFLFEKKICSYHI